MRRLNILWVFCLTAAAASGQVAFSSAGGFYPEPFTLTLSAGEGMQIHFTTDGSVPTAASPLYCGPLMLSEELYSSRSIYQVPCAPDDEWNPPSEVLRAIVLRAAAFSPDGTRCGPVATHSYFIASLLGFDPLLPAVSLAIAPEALFDPDTGIFSLTGFDPADNFNTGNFNQHGREWERLAHVEFYEPSGSGFSQPLGLRTHGGNGRRFMQKCLKLYARSEYGDKKIRYPLFDNLPFSSYKRLVLKPFSSSWSDAGLEDFLSQQLAVGLRFSAMATRPVTLFINGEYWGIYFLQESPDERYVEQRCDVDEADVDVIGSWLGLVENGSSSGFLQMMRWLEAADLADTSLYRQFCTMIDINEFIDYQLYESFIANADWPANNMRCYQYGAAPWRWLFYDGDAAFINADRDMAGYATYVGADEWPSCSEATLCLRQLLRAPDFQQRFLSRLQELTASHFAYSRTSPILSGLVGQISGEVARQCARFGIPDSRRTWVNAVADIDRFLSRRPPIYFGQMESLVLMPDTSCSAFSVFPNPAHGELFISSAGGSEGYIHCLIYDLQGRTMMSVQLHVTETGFLNRLSVAGLPPGIYLLRILPSGQVSKFAIY